jgi:hypothetical protein
MKRRRKQLRGDRQVMGPVRAAGVAVADELCRCPSLSQGRIQRELIFALTTAGGGSFRVRAANGEALFWQDQSFCLTTPAGVRK